MKCVIVETPEGHIVSVNPEGEKIPTFDVAFVSEESEHFPMWTVDGLSLEEIETYLTGFGMRVLTSETPLPTFEYLLFCEPVIRGESKKRAILFDFDGNTDKRFVVDILESEDNEEIISHFAQYYDEPKFEVSSAKTFSYENNDCDMPTKVRKVLESL